MREIPQTVTNSLENQPVFEIHVSFSRELTPLYERLGREHQEKWTPLYVSEVLNGPDSTGCFDAHEVPGMLALMATMRVNSESDALAEVNRLAALYRGEPNVRIELEQVLATFEDEGPHAFAPVSTWTPTSAEFSAGCLVDDTPAFETHFTFKSTNGSMPILYSAQELLDLAVGSGIPVHQIVNFGSGQQISMTTFFDSLDSLRDGTNDLAPRLRTIASGRNGMRFKTVAERILACIQPFD